jgi:hypothetical protein
VRRRFWRFGRCGPRLLVIVSPLKLRFENKLEIIVGQVASAPASVGCGLDGTAQKDGKGEAW